MFNIPKQFTQGDCITWKEKLDQYNPATDNLSCFIRGQNGSLDLTATPLPSASPLLGGTEGGWEFLIPEVSSATLAPGVYKVQFVIVTAAKGRQTLGEADLEVCPSFEDLTTFDARDADEIELEAITKAIAELSSKNVAEYYIGTRRVRYNNLTELYERQKYLRNRIAKRKNKSTIGGRNVGIRFCD